MGFKIEISSNIKIVNFLDVTLDLSNNSYKSFIKSNQNRSYINVNSNHPKNIIKQISKAVNLRIGKLSANEKIFKESSKRYTDALKNSGFKEDFRYLTENITNEFTKENNIYDQKNKNRKRKIIWFNPPFCKLANIDVGKYFLRVIDKHFKQDNILHKIFNRKKAEEPSLPYYLPIAGRRIIGFIPFPRVLVKCNQSPLGFELQSYFKDF